MTGLRPTRSDSRAAGIVAIAVQAATTIVIPSSQVARSSGSTSPSDRSRNGTDRTMRKALPPRMKKRDATQEHEAPLGEDVGPPGLAGDRPPAPAPAVLGASALVEAEEQRSIVTSSMTPSAMVGMVKSPVAGPDGRDRRCRHDAEDLEQPDHPAREAHLRGPARGRGRSPGTDPGRSSSENWSRMTNGDHDQELFDVAMPMRNSTSSSVPMTMYGFRRPKREMV